MAIKPNVINADTYVVAAVTVANTATVILAKNNNRVEVVLYNNGAATIFVGPSTVTTAAGLPIAAGASLSLNGQAALYGIVAAGTEEIRAFCLEDD
jgi:hypothetical protein